MTALLATIWIGLSASLFAIWVILLCRLRAACRSRQGAAHLARIGAIGTVLLAQSGLGLLLWPP